MPNYTDYFAWLDQGAWIRISARALIFDPTRTKILVEQNMDQINQPYPFVNFIGGGVETGETLIECLARELTEETNAHLVTARYLFVVENFIAHNEQVRHSLEHYFELTLDRPEVEPRNSQVKYLWVALTELKTLDLRPAIVRDCLADGSYQNIKHLQTPNVIQPASLFQK